MGREQIEASTLGLSDTAALQPNEADPNAQREGLAGAGGGGGGAQRRKIPEWASQARQLPPSPLYLLTLVQRQLSRGQGSEHLGLVSTQLQHASAEGSWWVRGAGMAQEALFLQAGLQCGAPYVTLSWWGGVGVEPGGGTGDREAGQWDVY